MAFSTELLNKVNQMGGGSSGAASAPAASSAASGTSGGSAVSNPFTGTSGSQKISPLALANGESVFGNKEEDKKTESKEFKSYEEWKATMQARGFTHFTKDDFSTYIAGLDDDFKKWLLKESEGGYTESDKALQAKVGSIYESNGRNELGNQALVNTLNANGLNARLEWHSETGHIVDNLSGTGSSGAYTSEGVSVIVVTDPETGAEIRIADTNGNGSIEIEEVFFNEILEGVASSIDASQLRVAISGGSSSGGGGSGISGSSSALNSNGQPAGGAPGAGGEVSNDGKTLVTQKQYDSIKEKLKEKYTSNGDNTTAGVKAAEYMAKYFTVSNKAKMVDVAKIIENA